MKIHQTLFQYLLRWHKHAQYIAVPDDWGNLIPRCFSSVFGLCKILNDRSAEQETVDMVLRTTTNFPKFQRALWPKKIGWDSIFIPYTYFIIVSANFANILEESSLWILAYRAFHLNYEWNFAILFHWLTISSSNHRD